MQKLVISFNDQKIMEQSGDVGFDVVEVWNDKSINERVEVDIRSTYNYVTRVRSDELMNMSRDSETSMSVPMYLRKDGCVEDSINVAKNQFKCHLNLGVFLH